MPVSKRLLVGSGDEATMKKLKIFFKENGYEVLGGSTDGYELLRQVRRFYPDLCIFDFSLKGLNGHELSRVLVSDRLTPVIVLLGASEVHHFSTIKNDPFFTYVKKPLNRQVILTTVELVNKYCGSIKKLEKEIKHLKKDMQTKAIIDRAKKLLMSEASMNEEVAHKTILTRSMNEGSSKVDVAKSIIEMYED